MQGIWNILNTTGKKQTENVGHHKKIKSCNYPYSWSRKIPGKFIDQKFEDTTEENLTKLRKDIPMSTEEAKKSPNRQGQQRNLSQHIIVKPLSTENK